MKSTSDVIACQFWREVIESVFDVKWYHLVDKSEYISGKLSSFSAFFNKKSFSYHILTGVHRIHMYKASEVLKYAALEYYYIWRFNWSAHDPYVQIQRCIEICRVRILLQWRLALKDGPSHSLTEKSLLGEIPALKCSCYGVRVQFSVRSSISNHSGGFDMWPLLSVWSSTFRVRTCFQALEACTYTYICTLNCIKEQTVLFGCNQHTFVHTGTGNSRTLTFVLHYKSKYIFAL